MFSRHLFTVFRCRRRFLSSHLEAICYSTENANKNLHPIDSNDQTVDHRQMLRTIVDTHLANGHTFFLPWADDRAVRSMLFPFQELTDQGVTSEFLVDACTKSTNLFMSLTNNGREAIKKLGVFVENFEMTFEDAMRFYAKWADGLDCVSPDSLQQRLSVFLGRGILSGFQLRGVVQKCPEILFMGSPQKMDTFWENVSEFFTLSELKKLMVNSPHICLMDSEEIKEIYEYIYFHMGINSAEMVESTNWFNLHLDQIMSRHEFLLKTGKYTFPDPKKPQLKKENPMVSQIFDVEELEFATKVACVSHEEWVVFQDLRKQEEILSEKERPYEKIKPSMRKSLERKNKEAAEKQAGEMDG